MTSTRSALDADWLGACRRAVDGLERMLADAPSTEERDAGDRLARERRRPHAGDRRVRRIARVRRARRSQRQGYRFAALSEERGEIDYGDSSVRVIIDPIDGSLNAKRGLPHHALSMAVAAGETMADVVFGFVYDFGPARGVVGARGRGRLAGRRAAGSRASGAARPRRAPGGPGDRVGRPALGRELDRCARGLRLPAAGARHDRLLAVPGRRRALRRHGLAAQLPRASTPPPAS